MANPAELALRRPRVVLLATLLVAVYGALSWVALPRQENPEIEPRWVEVLVYLPGAEPDKVERLVTRPLEEKIAEVDDLAEIFSTSSTGLSYTRIEVRGGAPVAERIQQLRDKVQQASDGFPESASDPEVNDDVFRTQTVLLALTGDDVDPLLLRREARRLERELELLADVRGVSLLGEPREEIEVAVDLRSLSQRRIPLGRVVDALAARNANLPGGELEVGAMRSSIRTSGTYEVAEHVGATVLGTGADHHSTTVADVSRVQRKLADPDVVMRHDGRRGVSIAIEMLDHRNVVAFGARIRAWVAERSRTLPVGLELAVVADEPAYVGDRLAILSNSLLLGMALVAGLAILGLGWRTGAIVTLSIPLSVLAGIGMLDLWQIPLHQISIAALVIGLGLVVDEAIVVSDNVKRKLDAGMEPRRAAVEGLGEIHLAILAGVATTVVAFLPLYLMTGDIGAFVESLPIVVSSLLLGSALVAHFVTPLAMAYTHRPRPGGPARPVKPVAPRAFDRILAYCLDHRPLVFAAFGAGLVASIVAIGTVLSPPVLFPKADRHQLVIDVGLPPRADPRVADFISFEGADAPKIFYNEFPGGRGENRGMFVLRTASELPLERHEEMVLDLNRAFRAQIAGAWVRARQLAQGYGVSSDITIFLQGDNLSRLRQLASRVADLARQVPGVRDARDSFGYDAVTLEARVDGPRAAELGISHADVATILRSAVDGVTATTLPDDDEEIDIVVRVARSQRRTIDDLESLPVYSPARQRALPLAQVATLAPDFATGQIQRWNRKRQAQISVDVEGRNVVAVTNDVERAVRSALVLPAGYTIEYQGERQEIGESFLSLAQAAVVAVFLIYIVLVVRFQSLLQPLLIVLAMPMALMGSVLGLVVTGNPLSFNAFLGFIALAGIVVNDSIVLVDTINRLRADGLPLRDAVRQGARLRVRAVLLTSLTTIGGLLPLSLKGGEFWAPFGFAMIFGLAASTLLTLLVQPASYLTAEQLLRRLEPLTGGDQDAPAVPPSNETPRLVSSGLRTATRAP